MSAFWGQSNEGRGAFVWVDFKYKQCVSEIVYLCTWFLNLFVFKYFPSKHIGAHILPIYQPVNCHVSECYLNSPDLMSDHCLQMYMSLHVWESVGRRSVLMEYPIEMEGSTDAEHKTWQGYQRPLSV